MRKTNAVRILESAGIVHETVTYDSGDEALDAISVADRIGVERDRVFKTLVLRAGHGNILVCVIPGPAELNLRKAALAAGVKNVELVAVREILPLTGYIRGACSPIGMKKRYPTIIDETAQIFDAVYISAGVRGMQIRMSPPDLCRITGARFADLI